MSTSLQITQIHTLKNILGLDDDLYREMLASFGVYSSKKHIIHTSIYRSKVIKLEVSLGEMCQKVSNKNVIIQSENITFFHFIITFMITFLNYIELIFIQKCNRYF